MLNFFSLLRRLACCQPGLAARTRWAVLLPLLLAAPLLGRAQAPVLTSVAPNTGPLETSVTITGQNLTGLTSVLVGAIPARFTVSSATTATAIVPRQAVNQRVRISRASGPAAGQGSALSAQPFAVTRPTTIGVFPQFPDLTTNGSNALDVGRGASPVATDLDGDGLLDLVVGDRDGNVTRFEQTQANGMVFDIVGALAGPPGSYQGDAVPAVTDLDGDGLLDLLVGNTFGRINRYEQTALNGGTFARIGELNANGQLLVVNQNAAPVVTDVDGDGLLDMLVGNGGGNVTRYEQPSVNAGSFNLVGLVTINGGAALNVGTYAAPTITDVDADGLLDLLVGNADGYVFRFEQTTANGDVFAEVGFVTSDGRTYLDVGDYANPTVTDVDGDGRLDLLVGNSIGLVQNYEQVGLPTISSFTPATGPLETSVTITGRSLPGLTSVLVGAVPARFTVTSSTTATVIIPRQAVNQRLRVSRVGSGSPGTDLSSQTFAVTRPGTLGVFPQLPDLTTDGTTALDVGNSAAPTVTDVDGDGLLDLLVGNSAGYVQRYEQTAVNGTVFAPLGNLTTNGTTALYVSASAALAVTDVDGDGRLDLLVGNSAGNIRRFEQTAANGSMFDVSTENLTANGTASLNAGYVATPTVTDVDGDGLLDLLVGNYTGVVLRYEQTAPNGTVFAPLGNLTTNGTTALNAGDGSTPNVTDVDGDGLLDLLVGNGTGSVLRYEQTAANGAAFALVGSLTTEGTTALDAGDYAAPAVTDVDGDGLLDLLVGNSAGNVQRYEQAAPPVFSSFSPGVGPLDTRITISGLNLGDLTSVLLGAVPARFTVTSPSTVTAIVPRQAVNQRLRVTRVGGGAPGTALSALVFAVTRPRASGAFELLANLTTDGSTNLSVGSNAAPAVTDLDGNGRLDLLVGNQTGTVTRFEQTVANGDVFAGVTLLTSNGTSIINMGNKVIPTVTDLDGDGLLDLLVGNGSGRVTRYEQRTANGDQFTLVGALTTDGTTALDVGDYSAPTVADVDGDGLLDLLVGNQTGNVQRFEQTAANGDVFAPVGTLTTDGSTAISVAGGIATPTVTDVEGNGLLDLLVGNGAGTVLRYQQTTLNGAAFALVGPLTTDGTTALNAGNNAVPVVTDVDGDGLLDLLIGNLVGNVQRYEQAAPPIFTSFTPNTGPLETSVTITGQNLTGLTSVLVGAVPARFTVSSPTTATAIVPRQAVNQRLRLTRAGGGAPGTALSGQAFVVARPSTSGVFPQLPSLTTDGIRPLDVGSFAKPAVTDVDGNGRLDLLVGNSAGTVTRYEQTAANGDVFAAVGPLTTDGTNALNAGGFSAPAVTDVDGDGLLDLLIGNSPGSVRRFEQTVVNGDQFMLVGNLTTDGTNALYAGGNIATPTVTDVDNDGLLDLLVGNDAGNVTRFEQTVANGAVFARVGPLTTNGTAALDVGDYSTPTITDLDGDGRLDLLVGNYDGSVLRFEQTAANGGVFASVGLLTTDGTNALDVGDYSAPTVTDVDGDGRLDLLVGTNLGNVQRYQQSESPTISSFTPASGPLETSVTITGQNLTGVTSVLVGAVPARFTVSSPTTATVIIPRQAVNQRLRLSQVGGSNPGSALSDQPFTVTRPRTTGELLRLPNLTTDGTTFLNPDDTGVPAVADVDGDGLLDLLVGNFYGTVRRYEQTVANGGVFALVGDLTTDGTNALNVGNKAAPAVTDLDGDGRLDLLVWENSGSVQRFEQTATNGGVFAPVGPLTNDGGTPLDVRGYAVPTVTDLDNDGLLDLLMGDGNGTVQRYEQTVANGAAFAFVGNLTTDGSTALDAGDYASPTVTDMDGDGLLDLLVGNLNGNVTRYEQTAANGDMFALVGPLTTSGPTALDAGDFAAPAVTDVDGDGLLDLLVFNDNHNVQRYEQAAATPLPVELTAFTATAAGPAAVRLAWATASEKNSARFEVERSVDGAAFAAISTVAAAGTSSAPRSYRLLDAKLPSGAATLYYRLRQVDADGTFSYSPVRAVAVGQSALALFPNPTSGAATLVGTAAGAAVAVFNAVGRLVLAVTADATGTAPLALPEGLASGVYIVRVGTQTLRLTVE